MSCPHCEETSKMATPWEELPDGKWRDHRGLIWFPTEPKKYTWDEAMRAFPQDSEKRLPTIEEWLEAESHGIRKVLPDMNHWFWSSSLYSYNSVFARFFVGGHGDYYYYYRYSAESVRCVARP